MILHRAARRMLTTTATTTPNLVWGKHVPNWLTRIQARVTDDVKELAKLSPNSDVWTHTIRSLTAIASVPSAKLIRPQLVLLGYAAGMGGSTDVLSTRNEGVEMFAAGVELQHLFMLIHDDVMDHGTIRRGIPTVNAELLRFGLTHDVVTNAVTVLGDLVHARALAMLVNGASTVRKNSPPEKTAAIISSRNVIIESSYKAAMGQFQDILGWPGLQDQLKDASSSSAFVSEFLDMKGADHTFVAPIIAGLRLSGTHDTKLEVTVRSWGLHAGLALQGLDDILDLVGDPITTGKDTSQDLREGRLSLPLVMMHGMCTPDEWRELTSMMGCVIGLAERRLWFSLMRKYNLLPRCMEWVERELSLAEAEVQNLPSSSLLPSGCAKFNEGLRKHTDEIRKMCV